MPVDGDSRAAVHASAGSSARASAPVSGRRSSTPLAAAAARMPASRVSSSASVATISLPQLLNATPRVRQKSYSIHLPRTHNRAIRLPRG